MKPYTMKFYKFRRTTGKYRLRTKNSVIILYRLPNREPFNRTLLGVFRGRGSHMNEVVVAGWSLAWARLERSELKR